MTDTQTAKKPPIPSDTKWTGFGLRLLMKPFKDSVTFCLSLFWLWRLVYLFLACSFIIPDIAWYMIQDTLYGNIPLHYTVIACVLSIVPFASVFIAIKMANVSQEKKLHYIYGVEFPLVLILFIYLMNLRDYGFGFYWLLMNLVIAVAAWCLFLAKRGDDRNAPEPYQRSYVAVAASTVIAMVGIYISIVILIFLIPAVAGIISFIGDFLTSVFWPLITSTEKIIDFLTGLSDFFVEFLKEMIRHPGNIINAVFFIAIVVSIILFITLSFYFLLNLSVQLIYLYFSQLYRRLRQRPSVLAFVVVTAVVLLNFTIFQYSTKQPQKIAFSLLEEKPTTDNQRLELLANSDSIRLGLLNAYLSSYRYASSMGAEKVIKSMYKDSFFLSESASEVPEKILDFMLSPLLYDGNGWSDSREAEQQYQHYFDEPIQKAERNAIVKTMEFNWENTVGNEAGLLHASQEFVHVDKQDVTVRQHGQVATISVSQTLINQTPALKETVMHFSLPESAVVTGVWLSDEADNIKKYVYAISPRGAAQAVYKAEVAKRVDPALLEKTGPYQYRLRAYPVPRNPNKRSRGLTRQAVRPVEPLYVTFEYQTLPDAHGHWPLPQILEKRNIYWDEHTKETVNGVLQPKTKQSPWVSPHAAEVEMASVEPFVSVLPQGITLYAVPRTELESPSALLKQGAGITDTLPEQKLAIVIDGSFSMQKQASATLSAIETIPLADVYFCRESCFKIERSELDKQVYFGASQVYEQLSALAQSIGNNHYDGIFMITDGGSYEIESSDDESVKLGSPLWLVHLNDDLPYAYTDKLLQLVTQSNGGITYGSIEEALFRHMQKSLKTKNKTAFSKTIEGAHAELLDVSRYWLWYADNIDVDESHAHQVANPSANTSLLAENPYSKIATAQYINFLSKNAAHHNLQVLDSVHRVAKQAGIVTAYSSMIVLVNDEQKKALADAEKESDRFDREVEFGKQDTTKPTDMLDVPAVPEPEEWALIIIVGLLLSYSLFQRRNNALRIS